MKVCVLTSVLPIPSGTPAQRISATLKRDLSRLSDVMFAVVDCTDTQWEARRKRTQKDIFLPHARGLAPQDARALLSWPHRQAPDALAMSPQTQYLPDDSGWMTAKRKARLQKTLQAEAPDVVFVADLMLWELATQVAPPNSKLVCFDPQDSDWLEQIARLHPHARQWADIVTQTYDHNRAIKPDQIIVPPAVKFDQEYSDLFMEKADQVIVLGTGNPWMDDAALQVLGGSLKASPRPHSFEDKLVFSGFQQHHTSRFPSATFHTHDARLHTMLGISRCLFVPRVTQTLHSAILAALSVGTPVLMTPADAARTGLDKRLGVFTCPEALSGAALSDFVHSPLVTPDFCRDIAREAAQTDPADLTDFLATQLAALSGKKVKIAKTAPAPVPIVRSPLAAPIEVLYDPIKEMLLVRAEIWGWSHLEELRLLNAKGAELTRLAPNKNQQEQKRYLLEGGLVASSKEIGKTLRLEGYCDNTCLFSQDIIQADFAKVLGGLVTANLEDGHADGTFWINSENVADKWFVLIGNELSRAFPEQGTAVPEIGVHLVPFRGPSHMGPNRRQQIKLMHQPAGTSFRTEPPQNVFRGSSPNPRLATDQHEVNILKDKHKGKKAWIIGNGPSVRHADLARIPKDDIIFCFNRFYLSYDDTPLREDYVVSADTLMIEDFGQEMIDVAHGHPLFCIPPGAVCDLQGDFTRVIPGASSVPDFSFDPARYVTVGGSSVFVALQMAWHMGLRDISLYGMDYSFSATLGRDPRYPFPVAFNDDNHFIKGYREAKPWCPPTWRDISAGFLNARLAFDMTGGRVRNATRGGKLELFNRVDFDKRMREKS